MAEHSLDSWEAQVRKGLLEYCLLESLDSLEQSYGYELLQRLRALPTMEVTESAVYPVLSRIAKEGLVDVWKEDSPSGPPRRWYRLSELGATRLEQMRATVSRLESTLGFLLREKDVAPESLIIDFKREA